MITFFLFYFFVGISGLDFGVEWVSWPMGVCNVIPFAVGAGWTSPSSGAAAPVDTEGWPTGDAYTVLFDYAASPYDPARVVPQSIWGVYTIFFKGKGDVQLYPGIGVIINSTFDPASFSTTAYVSLENATSSTPGLVIGVYNSQRETGGAGFTSLQVLQPGCAKDGSFYTARSMRALAPFHHTRVHEWSGTNTVPVSYPTVVHWEERRLATDVFWESGVGGKPHAVGAAWESVLTLSREAGNLSLWINVPVYASPDYCASLAALLRTGNTTLGIPGLNSPFLYIEHGNELWLNESNSPLNYAYNLAAAAGEVAAGGSPLNNDGATDPIVWAQRRHAARVREIAQVFRAAFKGSSVEIRPVYAWMQSYTQDAQGALEWLEKTYGEGEASRAYFCVAVNGYRGPGVFPPGTPPLPPFSTPNDVLAALLSSSDASRTARASSFALASSFKLPLCSYEGSGWAQPDGANGFNGEGFNATMGAIVELNRREGGAQQQAYDVGEVWNSLGRLEALNFYALSSSYPLFYASSFGLTEDIGNPEASLKYVGALSLIKEFGRM